jgi:hypothetical protein
VGIVIEVQYADGQRGYYHVPEDTGWRVDPAARCLVVGHGVPRKHIPLDNVQFFDIIDIDGPPFDLSNR